MQGIAHGTDKSHVQRNREIPRVLETSAAKQLTVTLDVRKRLNGFFPRLLATIGRGSSDHVATYLRSAFELMLGVPGASISPSTASIYGRRLSLEGALTAAAQRRGLDPDQAKLLKKVY